ncbi:MAG: type II secretion system minor pseudopilin GspK [Deltaproteobacteria bacterium]|nr:type II secretion system minor pseudopilin GspK [Deltaproteobacteria bacterium]MBW1919995.1 type II secretion system minor pseudopilin GspK [Deltaproteobacteria bacterium]MBW1935222.1 type II secretion system minor pseudopilin GspK [Deltaproteobacteria bacterium]MBW1976749.1 type II secretion system minor pseudopilin GspK [Deltaproteobacteria bacterium]MBW2044137.1 type II secretion system minor pseudopilin GspK [Deltaproteobacteria bacterium]
MLGLLKDKKGIALILTVLITSLIVALTLQFNEAMRSELYAAVNLRDGVKLECMARSGFDYALAVLAQDGASKKSLDSLLEPWADSKALSSISSSLFKEGSLEIAVTDLGGMIQLNALVDKKGRYNQKQKALLTRFLSLEQFSLNSEQVENIVDAIKDWIDPDNEVTHFGAERAYYESLDRPYSCKNEPLESLKELLLVRGITKELFYGTKEKPGISHYLSIYGDGKININTASPVVLRSLSEHLDYKMVEEMVAYRSNEENDFSQPTWYKHVSGMSSEVSIDDLVSTSSRYFRIVSEARQGSMSRETKGEIKRNGDSIEVLSYTVE